MPLALVTKMNAHTVLAAVNRSAEKAGLQPGLPLPDARARCPGLHIAPFDLPGDYKAIKALTAWCVRYTPWTAVDMDTHADGTRGLWLDISGSAHLFGGENALLTDLSYRLTHLGYAHRLAIADTPGAAWAVARFQQPLRQAIVSVCSGEEKIKSALSSLPVAALRIAPNIVEGLLCLGFNLIGQLLVLPRAYLTRRFGNSLGHRLDQALGNRVEIIQPIHAIAKYQSRLSFAEPITHRAGIDASLDHLLSTLCAQLVTKNLGARQLKLSGYRIEGDVTEITVGTSWPVRDPQHIRSLFEEKLKNLAPGFGIELLLLVATATDPLAPSQISFTADDKSQGLSYLLDRLINRFGPQQVFNLIPVPRHLPEHAQKEVLALFDKPKYSVNINQGPSAVRPLRLLAVPEPIKELAPATNRPPVIFEWRQRHYRVALADGPERILPEWWLKDTLEPFNRGLDVRDYFRIEDTKGLRFWVFRAGLYQSKQQSKWFIHGFFP